ncbi:hypothetical protein B0J18DRAFT_433572 [Chaetomium sp. MPI-SDFR-AT-0129]|nr:hypothetical protein B0J18DRAFT_433572 [Chaetomium sp. MPI-SDFR-AT-0129]
MNQKLTTHYKRTSTAGTTASDYFLCCFFLFFYHYPSLISPPYLIIWGGHIVYLLSLLGCFRRLTYEAGSAYIYLFYLFYFLPTLFSFQTQVGRFMRLGSA